MSSSTLKDKPHDFYGYLSTALVSYFNAKLDMKNLNSQDIDGYTRLTKIALKREYVKKAVMTIPYNVSHPQMVRYISDNFETVEETKDDNKKDQYFYIEGYEDIKLTYNDLCLLANGLKDILRSNFHRLVLLINYLKEIARICSKLKISIP